jgi:hypothetical protein
VPAKPQLAPAGRDNLTAEEAENAESRREGRYGDEGDEETR